MFRGILAVILTVVCHTAGAFEHLTVSEFQEFEAESGDRFRLRFTLVDVNGPVANKLLYLRSTLETLSANKLLTNEEGIAYLEIDVPRGRETTIEAFSQKGSSVTFSYKRLSTGTQKQAQIRSTIPFPEHVSAVLDKKKYTSETQIIDAVKVDAPENPITIDEASSLLQFHSPQPGSKIETGRAQYFEVWLSYEGYPLSGWPIEISTSKGVANSRNVITDSAGFATFTIRSDTEGKATVVARAGNLSEPIDVVFEPPLQARNHYKVRVSEKKQRSPVDLVVKPDQLGVVLKKRLDRATEQDIAKSTGLTLSHRVSAQIIVLSASEPLSRDTKWMLARELMAKYQEYIVTAGLMAKLKGTSQQLIISEEIIVRFHPPQISGQLIANNLGSLPFSFEDRPCSTDETDCIILRLDPKSGYDVLEAANEIATEGGVKYAQPNFFWFIDFRSTECPSSDPWCDPRYKWQWNLENTGELGGQQDADADVREAWRFTQGENGGDHTLIAVLDSSFHVSHPDLKPNLWQSNGTYGIRITNDSYPDLMNPSAIDPAHGTKAAGVAAARGGNGKGGTGVCPLCELLLIRFTYDRAASSIDTQKAIDSAWESGASVISNSWGDNLIDSHVYDAIDRAVANNAVVVFAMSNPKQDNCGENVAHWDISARHNVIAVSGVTDQDRRIRQRGEKGRGFGDCMDVLAPTRGGKWGIDTTTVKTNTTPFKSDYVDNFGGNSAAAPLVAGIAALMRTVNPGLSPLGVQRVLQDTADKVEPGAAKYHTESGFGDPPGGARKSHHGYGRVNAFEAVRLVAKDKGGKNNMDLFLRDHQWDWGNTEQDSDTKFTCCPRTKAKVQSVDIKIEVEPDETADTEISLDRFREWKSQPPKSGKHNRIYIRLRNRGQTTVEKASLRLLWAPFKDKLPDLPEKFWTDFEPRSSEWKFLEPREISHLEYSGASIAGCQGREVPECLPTSNPPNDKGRVFVFDSSDLKWNMKKQRLALIAVVDSDDDKVLASLNGRPADIDWTDPMTNVVMDNNVTLWTSPEPKSSKCMCIGGGLMAALLILLII